MQYFQTENINKDVEKMRFLKKLFSICANENKRQC